jgi:hypothetical protein
MNLGRWARAYELIKATVTLKALYCFASPSEMLSRAKLQGKVNYLSCCSKCWRI